jgi:hypothetical protein
VDTKPTEDQIVRARDALAAMEEQEIDVSPAVVARLRGAVEALDWVLGRGPALSALGG